MFDFYRCELDGSVHVFSVWYWVEGSGRRILICMFGTSSVVCFSYNSG